MGQLTRQARQNAQQLLAAMRTCQNKNLGHRFEKGWKIRVDNEGRARQMSSIRVNGRQCANTFI
jgi:hypothetical protein